MISFSMNEVMEGYHEMPTLYNKRLPLKFECTWGTDDLKAFIDSSSPMFLTCPLSGTIYVEGLCDHAAIRGYLNLNYPKNTLSYEFNFRPANKRLYLFTGKKVNVRWWNLPVSHTTCTFNITNEVDQLISTGVVFFKLKNALSFIKSLRVNFT